MTDFFQKSMNEPGFLENAVRVRNLGYLKAEKEEIIKDEEAKLNSINHDLEEKEKIGIKLIAKADKARKKIREWQRKEQEIITDIGVFDKDRAKLKEMKKTQEESVKNAEDEKNKVDRIYKEEAKRYGIPIEKVAGTDEDVVYVKTVPPTSKPNDIPNAPTPSSPSDLEPESSPKPNYKGLRIRFDNPLFTDTKTQKRETEELLGEEEERGEHGQLQDWQPAAKKSKDIKEEL